MQELGSGIDLVLLTEQPRPGPGRCEGFGGLPVLNPCLIIIQTDGSSTAIAAASALRTTLVAEILRLSPIARTVRVPCGGFHELDGCHGLRKDHCQKLLILISGGRRPFKNVTLARHFLSGGPTFQVLPVLPRNTSVSKVMPAVLSKLNIAFFTGSITTVIPDVFALAGLTTLERRVFISYRRSDAQALADQLFDALTHVRFEVFLDRFSVPPGVDFQRRLTEQLAHKSMVLLIESANILQSPWTTFEINYARQHRLGLLALCLPDGTTVPSLEPDERMVLKVSQFTRSRKSLHLTDSHLKKVVQRVETVHGTALVRRRNYLREAMSAALLRSGVTRQRFGVDGLLIAQGPSGVRLLYLTTRPPELQDFHLTGRQTTNMSKGIVIGPADAINEATIPSLNWLSALSGIPYFDEGRILDVARLIAGGSL